MILVDSSVWIDYFRGASSFQTRALDQLLIDTASPLAIADIALYEVLRGFRHEKEFENANRFFADVPVIEIGGRAQVLSAVQRYRALRVRGVTISGVADLLQASYCIDHNWYLLHGDTDFDAVEKWLGLKTWRPQTLN